MRTANRSRRPAGPRRAGLGRELNEQQLAAVDAIDGPVLVLSGAGTGKTTVVVSRIVKMLKEGCAPSAILGVTFTRKAAEEMKERLAASVDPVLAREVRLETFHSISLRLLRDQPLIAGLAGTFGVADANVSLRLIRDLLGERRAELSDRLSAELPDDPKLPRKVAGAIQRLKDALVRPGSAELSLADDPDEPLTRRIAALLYAAYQARLRQGNLADFGDLIMWPALAMGEDEALRSRWARRWSHIKVDEAQDSNLAQQSWRESLSRDHTNLCCVGDDDQTIHEWRGARPDFLLTFAERFPGARIIRLERNYRSTATIVRAGAVLVSNNRTRLAKTLTTDAPEGERIGTGAFATPPAEAFWIARELKGLAASDTAFVLYRSNFQSRAVEEALIEAGVPHRVHGSSGFYARAEVRDALALALVAEGPDASGIPPAEHRDAFLRAANLPPRGLGPASLALMETEAGADEDLLAAGLRLADGGRLRVGPRHGLATLIELRRAWQAGRALPLGTRLDGLLAGSGYLAWLERTEDGAHERKENLAELSAVAGECGSVDRLIDRSRRAIAMSVDGARIGLMTMHRSKGLEADVVILPSWSPGLFPPKAAIDLEGTPAFADAIESERRLAHVGLTRARRRCSITWLERGGPCLFVGEIPDDLKLDLSTRRRLQARSDARTEDDVPLHPMTAGEPSR